MSLAPVTYDKLIADIRVGLNYPAQHAPNDDLILLKAGDAIQLLRNEEQNTPAGWMQTYYDLPVTAGTKEYSLASVPGYSKPVRIHTINTADPFHLTRKIETCERKDVEQFYMGPNRALVGAWSCEVMVPYVKENGEPWIELFPEPATDVFYRIWFNYGVAQEPAPEDKVPMPQEFFRLARISTELLLLPYCQWPSIPQAQLDGFYRRLQDAKELEAQQYREQWRNYIQTSRVGGTGRSHVFGAAYLDGWW